MTVGRLVDVGRKRRGRRSCTCAACRSVCAGAAGVLGPGLSMGMSEDYPVAVEEGATVVRVGRAIFGARRRVLGPMASRGSASDLGGAVS